jgi:hypothetical protein
VRRPRARIAALDEIAVAEQHRRLLAIGLDAGGVDGKDIRPVKEIGDAAKTFRLALRAVDAARSIQPHQLAIGSRIDDRLDLDAERIVGRALDCQRFGVRHIGLTGEGDAVDREVGELQFIAVEDERRIRARIGIARDREARPHARGLPVEADIQIDTRDEEVAGAIILQADRLRRIGAHAARPVHFSVSGKPLKRIVVKPATRV